MINLEWFRTFRTVYKTGSLTKAAEQLMLSQPAVSQHLAALEAHAGKKLFERKSKGVQPTGYARILNNMIANSFDDFEEVESSFTEKSIKLNTVIDFGISEHLYKSVLSDRLFRLGEFVHLKFGEQDNLVSDVEEGALMAAIVPKIVNTFDTACYPLFKQKLVLVFTPDVNINQFKRIFKKDKRQAEQWLSKQNWYSHRPVTPFIKQFWLNVFDKKRPSILPRYIIPNEYEVLERLSKSSGMAICYDTNADAFIKQGTLKSLLVEPVVERDIVLLVNKKKMTLPMIEKLLDVFAKRPNNKIK